jgi:hypothetical protein
LSFCCSDYLNTLDTRPDDEHQSVRYGQSKVIIKTDLTNIFFSSPFLLYFPSLYSFSPFLLLSATSFLLSSPSLLYPSTTRTPGSSHRPPLGIVMLADTMSSQPEDVTKGRVHSLYPSVSHSSASLSLSIYLSIYLYIYLFLHCLSICSSCAPPVSPLPYHCPSPVAPLSLTCLSTSTYTHHITA